MAKRKKTTAHNVRSWWFSRRVSDIACTTESDPNRTCSDAPIFAWGTNVIPCDYVVRIGLNHSSGEMRKPNA